MSHSKTPRGSDLDLSLEHHRSVVEELKSNVLQHMSLTSPPSGYNVNQNKTRGKLIRDFYRRKLNSTNHSHISENGEFYLNDLQTFVFQSTGKTLNAFEPYVTFAFIIFQHRRYRYNHYPG